MWFAFLSRGGSSPTLKKLERCRREVAARLTCFHEVAVGGMSGVGEDVVLDGVELREVVVDECVACACRAVVVQVGEFDASINEEPQRVRRQVHRQHDEVDVVVAVEQVDSRTAAVQRLALHPQQTSSDEHACRHQTVLPDVAFNDAITREHTETLFLNRVSSWSLEAKIKR